MERQRARAAGRGPQPGGWGCGRGLPPYVALAQAVFVQAAQEAALDNGLGVHARAWLRGVADGQPGWWDLIPRFDPHVFAVEVLRRIARQRASQPSAASPRWETPGPGCYEQLSLFVA